MSSVPSGQSFISLFTPWTILQFNATKEKTDILEVSDWLLLLPPGHGIYREKGWFLILQLNVFALINTNFTPAFNIRTPLHFALNDILKSIKFYKQEK